MEGSGLVKHIADLGKTANARYLGTRFIQKSDYARHLRTYPAIYS